MRVVRPPTLDLLWYSVPKSLCLIGISYEKALLFTVSSKLFVNMGGCISMPKRRFKPNTKYFCKPRKFRRKITSSVSVAPIEQFTGAENRRYTSLPEFVSVNTETRARTSCRCSQLPDLTLHCTELQCDHNQVTVNGKFSSLLPSKMKDQAHKINLMHC